MSPRARFVLAVVVLAALMLGPVALTAWLLWTTADAAEQGALASAVSGHAAPVVVALALAVAAGVMLLRAVFRVHVSGVQALGERIRTLAETNAAARLDPAGPEELCTIARAANALADQRDAARRDVETQIACAHKSLEEERNRLAALMGELTQSVVVCNLDGRILLYNTRARQQFRALSATPEVADGGELIGLGRSIYAVFERSAVHHALEAIDRQLRRGSREAVASFVTTCGGALLRAQMSPVLSGDASSGGHTMTGFILLLVDITRDLERESRRDRLLHILTEGNRAALANVRMAAETLELPDLDAALRQRLLAVVREEVCAMSARLNEAAEAFADALRSRWPMEDIHGADLVEAVRQRIAERVGLSVRSEEVEAGVWLSVDSFSLLQALTYLASRLADEFGLREVSLRLAAAGRFVHLDLVWAGHAASTETLMPWELDPITVGTHTSPLTVRDVLDRHGGEIWFERDRPAQRCFFRLLLPAAAACEAAAPAAGVFADSRPEYYDFDIFSWSEQPYASDDQLLAALSYTAFDTETTGLDPSGGDEIIQIGATRIVNGKLLRGESFEQLVDPGRTMSAESIAIHGIRPEMLVGQPAITVVLPAFHAFAAGSVLVAHNAAFDMRFLQLKEAATGLRFDQPVLDTLLLSAVLHPHQESHRLEAIAERLGVVVVGRHTALGDALVTAEVFIRMLPLLAERGIRTLGQAREACERSFYARVRY